MCGEIRGWSLLGVEGVKGCKCSLLCNPPGCKILWPLYIVFALKILRLMFLQVGLQLYGSFANQLPRICQTSQ